MNAIVLDGHLKGALAIVRSLGRKGISVSVGAERPTAMALHSRYTSARFTYLSPYQDQRAFIETVRAEAERIGGRPVVYALSDVTTLTLYAFRDELAPVLTLVFPEDESMELAFNKAATYSLAKVTGVPTIITHLVESNEEIERLGSELSYPAVVKPRRSVTWRDGRGFFGSAMFVHSLTELTSQFRALRDVLGEAPLVQLFMRGEEYGVEMLVHDGVPFATIVHHRMRSLSPTGGASVLKETVGEGDLQASLTTYAEILARRLAWRGPLMVEFKIDSDTKEPKLMEINGRFWGSLPLSVAASVDVPYLYYEYARERTVPEVAPAPQDGVVTRHFLGDVRNLMKVFFARDRMRPILYPSRKIALRDFFRSPRGTMSDVWLLQDMKPSFMEIIDAFKKTIWK